MTSWADHAILWQVYPLGFTGAEPAALPAGVPVRHRLRHLEAWLDYAVELGCNGLLLGPVFAAQTHGYDTTDHFRIDARLGDEDDFDALVTAADQRGLRLILDGVFNHVGRGFPAFKAAVAGGPGTPAARWFKRTADGSDYAVFEGHGQLVELDHDEPAVLSYVIEVMTHWLGRGAGGWRLDAAYAVPPSFWAKAVPAVREAFPGAWFLGEMIHGDYAAYAAEAGLDSITQYEVWKAIWSSLNDRNFYELDHALGRHNAFMDGELAQTFVGNHDVSRLATILNDDRHFSHALAVLFCIGGVPSVYYGDEQGFRGLKEHREGGDDAIRPAFPASPAGPAARRVALLPAAPAADRLPPASPVAGPRPHGGRAPGGVRPGPAPARRGRRRAGPVAAQHGRLGVPVRGGRRRPVRRGDGGCGARIGGLRSAARPAALLDNPRVTARAA